MTNSPPYRPGFGIVPEVLAGRSAQLDHHRAALLRGPLDGGFSRAVIGERGVGKTVFTTVLASRMREDHGWISLDYQARPGVYAIGELLDELPDAIGQSWRGRGQRDLQRELTVELNAAVIKVQGRLTDSPASAERSPAMALLRALRTTTRRCAKQGSGLLLIIDEAHSLTPESRIDLGMIGQALTSKQQLPLALTLTGTPELAPLLIGSGTFLERLKRTHLGMLSRDEAAHALLGPANARGKTWDPDALELVCDAAAGYPYFVQVGGEAAWECYTDGDPSGDHSYGDRIPHTAATHAVAAIQENADRIFSDRWKRLGPTQREYLVAIASLMPSHADQFTVGTGEVTLALGKEHTELSRVRSTLINEHRLLRSTARGEIEFTIPRFGRWLADKLKPASGHPVDPEFATPLAALTPRSTGIKRKAREEHAQTVSGDPAPSSDPARSPTAPAPVLPPPSRRLVPPEARISRDTEASSPSRDPDAER